MNTSRTHAHHRYVINFRDYPLRRGDVGEWWVEADVERQLKLRRQDVVSEDYPGPVAADWPALLGIVEEMVEPDRPHNPNNDDPDIAQLGTLYTAIDCTVLGTYGRPDIPTDCNFLLDYEIDEEAGGLRKKPTAGPPRSATKSRPAC